MFEDLITPDFGDCAAFVFMLIALWLLFAGLVAMLAEHR